MAQKHWGEAGAAGPQTGCGLSLEMGGDGLMEGGICHMGAVAFEEASGQFLVKGEERNGRWLMLAHFSIRGTSGGIQNTRDHLELQELDQFLAGGILVMFAGAAADLCASEKGCREERQFDQKV